MVRAGSNEHAVTSDSVVMVKGVVVVADVQHKSGSPESAEVGRQTSTFQLLPILRYREEIGMWLGNHMSIPGGGTRGRSGQTDFRPQFQLSSPVQCSR